MHHMHCTLSRVNIFEMYIVLHCQSEVSITAAMPCHANGSCVQWPIAELTMFWSVWYVFY